MKIRVLVVEDEPPIQRSICQKIEESNDSSHRQWEGCNTIPDRASG